jgi:hypothetical protein
MGAYSHSMARQYFTAFRIAHMVFPFLLSTPLQLFPEYCQAFKNGIRILVPGFPLRREFASPLNVS